MERFRAILGGSDGRLPTVELPFDAKERFGRARAPVRGTVDGTPFRTTVAVYGGRYYVGFRRELRDAAGIAVGDEVSVELELDDEERRVEPPPELDAALADDPGAAETFRALSYTHQREFAQWITEAKRSETRERRVAKTIEMLHRGEHR